MFAQNYGPINLDVESAFQLSQTTDAIFPLEMIRQLVDKYAVPFEEAVPITQKSFSRRDFVSMQASKDENMAKDFAE